MRFILYYLILFCITTTAHAVSSGRETATQKLFTAATATVRGEKFRTLGPDRTFQVSCATTAGAGASTVLVQVSDADNPSDSTDAEWITLATVTLVLSTTTSTDGFSSSGIWKWVRAQVTAISGTGAFCTAYVGNVGM